MFVLFENATEIKSLSLVVRFLEEFTFLCVRVQCFKKPPGFKFGACETELLRNGMICNATNSICLSVEDCCKNKRESQQK